MEKLLRKRIKIHPKTHSKNSQDLSPGGAGTETGLHVLAQARSLQQPEKISLCLLILGLRTILTQNTPLYATFLTSPFFILPGHATTLFHTNPTLSLQRTLNH